MMRRTARVVAVCGDAVWVEALADAGCEGCASPGSCGNIPAAQRGPLRVRVPLDADAPAPPLDALVEIGMPEACVLRAAALNWLLPLGGLLGGAVIGERMFAQAGSDIASMAGALTGLCSAMMAARVLGRRADAAPELLQAITAPDRAP
jgi:sigma-E factor negative regulatory protein RseC